MLNGGEGGGGAVRAASPLRFLRLILIRCRTLLLLSLNSDEIIGLNIFAQTHLAQQHKLSVIGANSPVLPAVHNPTSHDIKS